VTLFQPRTAAAKIVPAMQASAMPGASRKRPNPKRTPSTAAMIVMDSKPSKAQAGLAAVAPAMSRTAAERPAATLRASDNTATGFATVGNGGSPGSSNR
jgi:hypothetical protein